MREIKWMSQAQCERRSPGANMRFELYNRRIEELFKVVDVAGFKGDCTNRLELLFGSGGRRSPPPAAGSGHALKWCWLTR